MKTEIRKPEIGEFVIASEEFLKKLKKDGKYFPLFSDYFINGGYTKVICIKKFLIFKSNYNFYQLELEPEIGAPPLLLIDGYLWADIPLIEILIEKIDPLLPFPPVEDNSSHLYCNCSNPLLLKNNVGFKDFYICKVCGKEGRIK